MTLKTIFDPRIAAWFGILAPICASVLIGISIALSPWFDWTYNALSDLGISNVALLFNSGLLLTGCLTSLFAIALMRTEGDSVFGLLGASALLFVGIGTVGAGVYTEATLWIHMQFSLMCFGALIASAILFSIRFALDSQIPYARKFVLLATSLGSLLFIGVIILSPLRVGMATMEVLLALPIIPWYILLSVRLYRKRSTTS